MKTKKLKVNNVKGYEGEIDIKVSKSGIPLDKFWRDRLKDAEIDNCVEWVTAKAAKKPKSKPANKPAAIEEK